MLDPSLATAPLRSGYDYWNDKRAGRPMPSRADLDPAEIKPLLPHLVLVDVLHDAAPGWPLDFRYRLIGTLVDDHSSARHTGKRLSEIAHQRPPSQMWSNFSAVAESGRPKLSRVPYAGRHQEFLAVVDLVMPLSADGRGVDMLLIFVDYVPRQRNRLAD